MSTTQPFLIGVILTLVACEGPRGADGSSGAEGTVGLDGEPGENGTSGTDGAPGADSDCAGVPPLEIAGFENLPTDTLYVGFPSAEIGIDINGSNLTHGLSGFGLEFDWTSETTFTVTPTNDLISSYGLTVTDGCTVATTTLELPNGATYGTASLGVIHLYGPAGQVNVRPQGGAAADTLVGLGYEMYTQRFMVGAGPWAFDLVSVDGQGNETILFTTQENVFLPNRDYTAVVHDNNGGIGVLLQEVSTADRNDPNNALLRATHLNPNLGRVDILDATYDNNHTLLFGDLDLGTSSGYLELSSVDVLTEVIGIDSNADGQADVTHDLQYQFGSTMGDFMATSEVLDVYTYTDDFQLPNLLLYQPYGTEASLVPPSPNVTVSVNGSGGQINTSAYFEYTETVSLSGCTTLLNAELDLNIDDYFWEDRLLATVYAPNGSSYVVFDGFDYSQQVNGTFNSSTTGTMDSYAQSVSELWLAFGVPGSGDWTLSLYHDRNAPDPVDLNGWSLTLDCYTP